MWSVILAWRIDFLDPAKKDLATLDKPVARRITGFLRERVAPIEDPRALGQALRGTQLGELWRYRVAAYAYVGESVQDPGKYYRNNVAGTLSLLEAARDHGLEAFIFSSTCATYGIPARVPIAEDCPQVPIIDATLTAGLVMSVGEKYWHGN
jgi:UDP-glucose 4-epimerase